MTQSSSPKPGGPRPVPPQGASAARPASPYSRFIPREELQGFSKWNAGLDDFGGTPPPGRPRAASAPEAAPAGPTPAELQAQLHAARQAGYQDGYRDGLVALEGFKQSYAQTLTAQIGALLQSFDAEFQQLEQQIAAGVARAATALARQVVRGELQAQPELVARVAEEAVNAVLMSARHIRVLVNPQDQALVAEGAAEALAARGARLMASPAVERGGCRVESDAGVVDASMAARWAQAAASLGQDVAWHDADDGSDGAADAADDA